MKKHIVALTAIAALSLGTAGQAFASSVHTVEKGDTLWAISQENNVSVENIQVWNNLDSTIIYPSQQLQIGDSTDTYTVVSGDTIYGIAIQHGISVTELMTSNQLIDDLIHPGDKLVINGNKVKPQVSSSQSPANNSSSVSPSKPAATTDVKQEITVTATAYTASCKGCSGITSTGIDLNANPNQKVISVDPTVIPLGSKVWVEGYGEAIAGDTGGAIKGNKIDIYMPSYDDAINWGRQTVKVKILD